MAETRDGWGKAEVIIGAMSALGSIAIPVALFVVGNGLSERQRLASDKQVEADRVERMLGHLASDKAAERKLAVRVLEFFVAEKQFPGELLPAIVEIASTDVHEDVADTASEVLQKVAQQTNDPQAASAAQKGLAALPPRINWRPTAAAKDDKSAAAVADLAHGADVVVAPQAATTAPPPAPAKTELRYFRAEDAAAAQGVARKLAARGIKAELRDLSQSVGGRAIRPRSFDLVIGAGGGDEKP